MKNKTLWTLTALVATLGLLVGCTSRLDKEQAGSAATRAARLYVDELQERAPRLQPQDLHEALGAELEALDSGDKQPALRAQWLSAQKPRFVTTDGPRQDELRLVQQLCAQIPLHALDPAPYGCQRLMERAESAAAQRKELEAAYQDIALPPEQVDYLTGYLTGMEEEKLQAQEGKVPDEKLVQIMFGPGDHTPLAQIDVDLARIRGLVRRQARLLARVEVDAHQVLLQFAWDMRARHAGQAWTMIQEHKAWLDDLADREAKRTRENQDRMRLKVPADWPSSSTEAITQRLSKDMAQLAEAPLDPWLRSLLPPGDQYSRLLRAHDRYRKIAQEGFTEVPKDLKARQGGSSKAVPALRQRLQQEGYQPGQGDAARPEHFDGALAQALKDFQRAHQLQENGKLDRDTWEALQVPASRRVAQLQLALQKWRQSPDWGNKHLFINIPDYHGEFWVDGALEHRFRVVVGNTTRKNKPGEGRVMVNATPRLWAAVDRVIYNPYWNIPDRILNQEILNEDAKGLPDEERQAWLAQKGYEVRAAGTKWAWVRQPPGPGNALGQVKIIFPNPHDVYLHDTPSKNLFSRPRRAFSHGCMRVHQPLSLARKLLERDGQFKEREIDRLLARHENQAFPLKEQVSVQVGYITVHVDDRGTVAFLDDVYQLDGERLKALERHGYAARREAP